MKSEQASILGKRRRQIAQPSDSPFQRPPAPRSSSDNRPLNTPSASGAWDHATPLPGQPLPHFGQVTQPSGPAPSRGLPPASLDRVSQAPPTCLQEATPPATSRPFAPPASPTLALRHAPVRQ